jgi:hypothetical protein
VKPKTLAILAGSTVVVLAAAYFISSGNEASVRSRTVEKGKEPALAPDLAKRVNDAAKITIKKGDQETILERSGSRWLVASRSGYPADFEKVRTALIGLSDAKIVAEKTSKPERYELIGVKDFDPAAKDSQTMLVTVNDASGAVLASIILGKAEEAPKSGDSPFGMPTGKYFVRRAGEAQSYLADIKPPGDASPLNWMKREMIALSRARTRSATVTHAAAEGQPAGETLTALKAKAEDAEFSLESLPAGRELNYPGSPSQVATALEYITFDDVKPASEVDLAKEPVATTVFRTFDGLVLTAKLSKLDGKDWMTLEAASDPAILAAAQAKTETEKKEEPAQEGLKNAETKPEEATKTEPPTPPSGVTFKTPDEIKSEVDDLNSKLKGWAFQIPDYKAKQIASHVNDLLKPAEPPTNPTQGPAIPPGPGGPSLVPEESGPTPLPPPAPPPAEPPKSEPPPTTEPPKQDPPKEEPKK